MQKKLTKSKDKVLHGSTYGHIMEHGVDSPINQQIGVLAIASNALFTTVLY